MDYMTYVQTQSMKAPKGEASPHVAGALFDVCKNIVLHVLDVVTESGLINVPQEIYEKVKGLRHTWKGEAKKMLSVQCSGMTQKKERCRRRVLPKHTVQKTHKEQEALFCRHHDPSKLLYSSGNPSGKGHKSAKKTQTHEKRDCWKNFVWGDSASWNIVLDHGPNGTGDLTHQHLLELAKDFGYQYLNDEWCLIPSEPDENVLKGAHLQNLQNLQKNQEIGAEKEETLEDHVKESFVRLCKTYANNREYTKVIDMINAKGKEISTDPFHPLRVFLREFKNEIWNDEEKWENEGRPCTEEQKRRIEEYLAEKEIKSQDEEKEKMEKEIKAEEERANERTRRAKRKQCDLNEIRVVKTGKDLVKKSDWKIMGVSMKELILVRDGLLHERKLLLEVSKEVQAEKEGRVLTLSSDEDMLFSASFRNIDSLKQQDYTSEFHVLKSMPTNDYIVVGKINMNDYIEDLCNMYVPEKLLWDILHGDEFL